MIYTEGFLLMISIKNTTIEKLKSQAPSVEINVVLSQSENDDIENEN